MLLDLIFGAIILILIGIGIYKGITGMFFGAFSILLSIIIAFFLADIVAQQILVSPMGGSLIDYLTAKISGLGEVATAPVVLQEGAYFLDTSEGLVPINEAFEDFGMFSGLISKYANSLLPTLEIEGMSLADKFVPSVALLILSTISGLVMFLLAAIVFKILGKVTENWDENPIFHKVNRILGFLLMAFIGIVIVNFLMLAASKAPHVSFFNALAEMTEGTYLSKYFYNNNWLDQILSSMGVDTTALFNRYFPPPSA